MNHLENHVHSLLLENRANYLRTILKAELKKRSSLDLVDLGKLNKIEDFAEYATEDKPFARIRSKQDMKRGGG
jgi:hypothetical protein